MIVPGQMGAIGDVGKLWSDEYQKAGVPSSFRSKPSGSVVEFVEYLRTQSITRGAVLDVGFGTGRNSLYLAGLGFQVYGIEIVRSLVQELRRKCKELNLETKVRPTFGTVDTDWPYSDSKFDAAVDTFCYKHLIGRERRLTYQREIGRVVSPGGKFLLTLAAVDDGYYGPLLDQAGSPDDDKVIIDPANGIRSTLYTKDEVERDFFPTFELAHYSNKVKEGLMHGRTYVRSTHVFTFSRRSYELPKP